MLAKGGFEPELSLLPVSQATTEHCICLVWIVLTFGSAGIYVMTKAVHDLSMPQVRQYYCKNGGAANNVDS